MIKVSICCAVYNHEKYLRDALESFVSQNTDFEYEVLIHDDASTDCSAEIIMEYAKKYPDIIVPIIQKENQYSKGIPVSRTFLYPRVRGEYIAYCEGDDYWIDSQKLQKQVEFLDNHEEYSACVHNTYLYDMITNQKSEMYTNTFACDIQLADAISVEKRCFHLSSLMCRKSAMVAKLPNYYKYAKGFGDYAMALFLLSSGKIRYLPDVMSVYRQGTEGSWTSRHRSNMRSASNHYRVAATFLEKVSEEIDPSVDMLIKEEILYCRYQELFYAEDYAELKKGIFRTLYKRQPMKYKILLYFKQHFKRIYHLYRKQKYKG